MGKASSAKKVAKAARAGGRGGSGIRERNLLFPSIISVIVILGVALIAFARSDYQDEASTVEPIAFKTHWHAGFGVFICGEAGEGEKKEDNQGLIDVTDQFDSSKGIHSHGDEVLHIHPTSRSAAGDDATLGVYVDESELIDISDDEITVGDESWKEGEDTCNGKDAEVVVAQWDDVLGGGDPAIIKEDLKDLRFRKDGEGYVVAFVPEGEYDNIPIPRSAAKVAEMSTGTSPEDLYNNPSQAPQVNPEDVPEGVDASELLEQQQGGGGAGGSQPPAGGQPSAGGGSGGSGEGSGAEEPSSEGSGASGG